MIFNASSHIPWHRRTFIAYSDWAHLLMTLDTCSVTDGWKWWRRAWWSLLCGRCPAALVDYNLERCVFSSSPSEYDFQQISSVQREILTVCRLFNMIKFCFSWLNIAGRYNQIRVIRVFVHPIAGCDSTQVSCVDDEKRRTDHWPLYNAGSDV